MDTVRVIRIIEYTGPRDEVEKQITLSMHGTKELKNGVKITVVTLGTYPELLSRNEVTPKLIESLLLKHGKYAEGAEPEFDYEAIAKELR